MDLLERSVDRGDPEAARAMDLLEALAADRSNSVHGLVTERLFARSHPWAVESTRVELNQFVGGQLAEVVSRIIGGPAESQREMAALALTRLETQTLAIRIGSCLAAGSRTWRPPGSERSCARRSTDPPIDAC